MTCAIVRKCGRIVSDNGREANVADKGTKWGTIDDSDIEALRQEAGQAGDYSMAAMCAVALGQRDYWDDVEDAGQDPYRAALTDLGWMTQTDARTECARVIRQTRAELAE